MSDLSLFSGVERKSHFGAGRTDFDPEAGIPADALDT
jgi:hypothetical protein